MMINGDYPTPILVNGYSCRNCADVSKARKNIDPAEASFGSTAETDPSARLEPHKVNPNGGVERLRLLDIRV